MIPQQSPVTDALATNLIGDDMDEDGFTTCLLCGEYLNEYGNCEASCHRENSEDYYDTEEQE